MLKYVKDLNSDGYYDSVFEGTDTAWAIKQGFIEEDVEQSYHGRWYPANAVPADPALHERAQNIQMTKREFLKLVIALTKDMMHPETGEPMEITLGMIEAYVASASDEIRLEWDYATYIERKHPLLDTVSASFGISSDMLDIIFVNKDELLHKIDNGLPLHT